MADEPQSQEESPEFSKVALGLLIAIVILGGVVYAGYTYSQRQAGKTTMPNGYPAGGQPQTPANIDCTKPREPNANIWDYYGKCDLYKIDASTKWIPYQDKTNNFEFSLPETAQVVPFTNGLGMAYKELNPGINLIYSLDFTSSRSGELKNLTGKSYVENYWKQYAPGLTGVYSLEEIINSQGAKAWKATYLVGKNPGNTEVFFELGENTGDFVHFTKGILDQPIFDNIIGTFKQTKPGSAPTAKPTTATTPSSPSPTVTP